MTPTVQSMRPPGQRCLAKHFCQRCICAFQRRGCLCFGAQRWAAEQTRVRNLASGLIKATETHICFGNHLPGLGLQP